MDQLAAPPSALATPSVGSPGLSARNVGYGYSGVPVLHELSLTIQPGQLTALVGPNGSGKSTLLSLLARLAVPTSGEIRLGDDIISSLPTKQVARHVALLPQTPIVPEAVTVFDLVSRGRFPHQTMLRRWTEADTSAVETAMAMTNTLEFASRPVNALSGGQRQRCWIAMALAQDTGIILLDEPTSALDLHYQLEILDLLHSLTREHGRTIVIVLHDLNLAASHADHMVFLKDGRIVADGATAEVCSASNVEAVFGVPVHVLTHPETGRPIFAPRGTRG
ncbi:MAG: ABC transporter ATP-binding protein [Devosia sp.]